VSSYQHKIAGSKRPSPEDIPGGILADEMGLCKTLSMISAIVATSRKAKGFQESTKPKDPSKCVVSSTLVIVPSYCRTNSSPIRGSRSLTDADQCLSRVGWMRSKSKRPPPLLPLPTHHRQTTPHYRVRPILIICYRHVKAGALSYYIYHGPGRKLDLSKSLPDIVLTTYGTVASECGRISAGSVLRQVHWYRIILDEGKAS
jgi:SWI/SNF-related matrix-associated actin-dependent regulator of chromatin subfamily A3